MGTQQTLDVLHSYALLLGGCGDSRGAEAVSALASALSSAGDAKVKATVTKVAKVWAGSPDKIASPTVLGSRLLSLQNLLAASGAKTTSVDIGLLMQLINGQQVAEPAEFEQALRNAILAPVPPRKTSRTPKRETLSGIEVREWADKLTATSADQAAFEGVLVDIQQIPGLSVPELRLIAEHYLGHEAPKDKKGILKRLNSRQLQDALDAGRERRISKIAV